MVLYKIMDLLSKQDTFGLFFTPSTKNKKNLGDILVKLSSYEDLTKLEADILEVFDQAMTEYGNDHEENVEERENENKNNVITEGAKNNVKEGEENDVEKTNLIKEGKNKPKYFLNTIHYNEASRLKTYTISLFDQAKEIECNFKPDYTDKIITNYAQSISEYVKGVELVDQHVKWILS